MQSSFNPYSSLRVSADILTQEAKTSINLLYASEESASRQALINFFKLFELSSTTYREINDKTAALQAALEEVGFDFSSSFQEKESLPTGKENNIIFYILTVITDLLRIAKEVSPLNAPADSKLSDRLPENVAQIGSDPVLKAIAMRAELLSRLSNHDFLQRIASLPLTEIYEHHALPFLTGLESVSHKRYRFICKTPDSLKKAQEAKLRLTTKYSNSTPRFIISGGAARSAAPAPADTPSRTTPEPLPGTGITTLSVGGHSITTDPYRDEEAKTREAKKSPVPSLTPVCRQTTGKASSLLSPSPSDKLNAEQENAPFLNVIKSEQLERARRNSLESSPLPAPSPNQG